MNFYLDESGRLRAGWRFLLSAAFVYAANAVAFFVAAVLAGARARLDEVIFRPTLVIFELAGFLAFSLLLDRPSVSLWRYNGLQRARWFRDTAIGFLLGFVIVGLAVTYTAIFHAVHIYSLRVNGHTIIASIVTFGVILAAAMAEELAFRGYPFQRLVEGTGPFFAILVLSALFGAVHLSNPHISDSRAVQAFAFTNTLYIGVVLALAYLRTRSLWLPWGLHFGWNFTLGMFFGLPVSGIDDFSTIVHSQITGPAWLLGGEYGLEGGFLGTIVITLGLLYVVLFVEAPAEPLPFPPPLPPEVSPPAPETVAELPLDGIQPPSGTAADL